MLVDKTLYLKLVLNGCDSVAVYRPRRFGKSMFLSMVERFYCIPANTKDKDSIRSRFKKMQIGKDTDFINDHCVAYPVIRLDLKVILQQLAEVLELSAQEILTAKFARSWLTHRAKKICVLVFGRC